MLGIDLVSQQVYIDLGIDLNEKLAEGFTIVWPNGPIKQVERDFGLEITHQEEYMH